MADQIGKWKTLRVFISSTFRDMHAERDHLVRVVFPELKEKCRKHRINLIDVDLRWGVSEADAEGGGALDICLDEIDSCRPYFLGLIGHRYGYIPAGHHHSITAQEIYHGVLHNDIPKQLIDLRSIIEGRFEGKRLSNEQINTLVKCYQFEDRKYILEKDISPEDEDIIRSVFAQFSAYQRDRSFFFFRKEALTQSLAEGKTVDFFESSPDLKDKLAALKQSIIDEKLPFFEYESIEEFGGLVRDTLWGHIEKEIGETPEVEKDWLQEERELHELFMADRTRRFVGRRDLLDKMYAAPASNIMLITGEPGCGKSALMARFSEEVMHQHPDWIILPHFVGASPNSTSLRLMLKRFCMQPNRAIGLDEEVPEDVKELAKKFSETLAKAAETHKILFIIDAVNQLEKTDNAHNMYWLPQELPGNVSFVISTLSGDAHDALMKRRTTPVEEIVHGLAPADVQELVKEYLKEIRHEFPNKQIETEFFDKVKAGNPLYILVALEELRVFGKFEELPQRVAELPDNVPALFDQVLQRIENDFNPALVKDMLSYIACGRHGMTAEELQTLLKGHAPKPIQKSPLGRGAEVGDSPLGKGVQGVVESEATKLPDMLWARLHRAFSSYLFERSGVIDFFHGQLKEAVGKRYLSEEAERHKVHGIIADYFEYRWREPYVRALDELPHQQIKAGECDKLVATLSTFMFLQNKVGAFGLLPVIEDYNAALKVDALSIDSKLSFPLVGNPSEKEDCGQAAMTELHAAFSNRRLLELIRGSIELSSHILSQDRAQLASQLWGRLLGFKDEAVNLLLSQAKESETKPWFRPITRSLAPPGGALLRTLEGHSSLVSSVAVTPDGRRAVSGSYDKTLKLWDIETGEIILTLAGHRRWITSAAVTPDGRRAVSGSMDNTLKVWNLETGEEIRTLRGHSDGVISVAVTPDGRRAVSGSMDDTLKVWDLDTGEEIRMLKGHSDSVVSVAVTPDGRRAVSGSHDNTLRVWALDTWEEIRMLKGHSDLVTSIAVMPDGKRVVSGSYDKMLKVWDLDTGEEILTLRGHSDSIASVAVTPDGRHAVSGSYDNTLKIWNLETREEIRTCKWLSDRITAHLVITYDMQLHPVAVTPDGRRAVSGSDNGMLKLWDIENSEEIQMLKGHSDWVTSVAVTIDSRRAVSGSRNNTLKVWDIENSEESWTIKGHEYSVASVAITPDGRRAVSGFSTLKVWDIESGEEIQILKGHSDWVTSVAVTPDGRRVVSGSNDKMLKVWDLDTGEQIKTLTGHSNGITAVAVASDSRRVLTGSNDGTLKVWDIESGEEIQTLIGHSIWVTSVAVTPDDRRAVSGSRDNKLKVWDIESGQEIRTIAGHSSGVTSVAVMSDCRRVVSGSRDNTLKLWDLESGDLIATFSGDSPMLCCAVTPDGLKVVAGDQSGCIHFLSIEGLKDR